jgi:hypothetical protein
VSSTQLIRSLFASDIDRTIEEVIKVDQRDEDILCDEIAEYVVTDSLRSHYTRILERYAETPNRPHEGIGIWVSGFYGAGKSSFAKLLGLSIENRMLAGVSASERFANRAGDPKISVLLKTITERIPTHAVIFDVSTDRGIRSGNQTLTEIAYGLLLQSLGYAKDLDLSELEIELEERGRLVAFEDEYRRIFNKEWSAEKGKVAFALNEASRVMHGLDPDTYSMPDSWVRAAKGRSDITPGKLARRADDLMKVRRPGHTLMFVIDEVGQFVARDVQKMLDLQALVQNLGVVSRGRHWIVVTSQERLGELVSGLDDKRVEHARLMDRFPSELQVHLEPSDISEVASRRVLAKNAAGQAILGAAFDEHRVRLIGHTRVTADIKLPALTRDAFIDLYPLVPYQVDLVIGVVSGLRTQGGSSLHVGGANRTIIKLAQQLLINPQVALANDPVGALVCLDQIYELVQGNIASELRAKIAAIPTELDHPHPLAAPVAKTICLLQFVKSVHRTPENIAACLHPQIPSDSQLALVIEALRQLEAAHLVRRGDDGYRITTAAEDDWERTRNAVNPKPGDAHRIYQEVIASLWEPQPSHLLLGMKLFKAGLGIRGHPVVDGDITFQFHFAEDATQFNSLLTDLRGRSRSERSSVHWAVVLTEELNAAVVELYRSRSIIGIKERDARTASETMLVGEERRRRDGHLSDLRKRLTAACLAGNVFFRGNDRSPSEDASDLVKSAVTILADVTPEIFERFGEAAARTSDAKKATDVLLIAANLRGLPPVFTSLGLLRDEKGNIVFEVEKGPLLQVLARIREHSEYGETASGRWLVDEFAKEPFGWDFEVVRLLTLCLLRAGSIEAASKGQSFDSALGSEALDTFSNNAIFRQASFRPKKPIDFPELVKAGEAFVDTFGSEVRELAQATIVAQIRAEVERAAEPVSAALVALNSNRLPGASALDAGLEPMRAILRGSEEGALTTFNASHRSIKDAIKRAAELEEALTESHLANVDRARAVLREEWGFLAAEPDVTDVLRTAAAELEDVLARETFFRDLPIIDQHAASISEEYELRHAAALSERVAAYDAALEELHGTPGWTDLTEEDRRTIALPIELGRAMDRAAAPAIPRLRSDTELCPLRLQRAVDAVTRAIDGDRVAAINLRPYFSGGIETAEQLEAALAGIREECARLIGAGKKIVIG